VIIQKLNVDIICISETHCPCDKNNQPFVDNYTWYGHCRKFQNRRINRAFGGVGIFVKNSVFPDYTIEVIDMSYDGILILQFCHKNSNVKFIVCSCYLPPEDSPYGRDADGFFSHLLSYMFLYSHVEKTFVCGDFNARIGALKDYIDGIDDNILQRRVIDNVSNDHGNAFIDFMQEANMCVTNGRIQGENDFTCISTRGHSVVDYIVVDFNTLKDCTKLDVLCMNDLLLVYNFQNYLSSKCKAPDHSIITLSFEICNIVDFDRQSQNTNICSDTVCNIPRKMYKFDNIPDTFLTSSDFVRAVDHVINDPNAQRLTQKSINDDYDYICKQIFLEMDKCLDSKNYMKHSKKNFKYPKPFWDEELTNKWKIMRNSEKLFMRCQNNRQTKTLYRDIFKAKRKDFDVCLRAKERKYQNSVIQKLEQIETHNPKDFWNFIKNLGPKKNYVIPFSVYCSGTDGIRSSDKTIILLYSTDGSLIFTSYLILK
jgi:hypothetical protein